MQTLKIALRNLQRQKKRTILLGTAIGFGIMIITLVNGFSAGASENLKDNFSNLLAGHIYISEQTRFPDGTVVSEFKDFETLEGVLKDMNLDSQGIVRRSSAYASLYFGGKRTSLNIDGVDWAAEKGLLDTMVLSEGDAESILADPTALVLNEQAAKLLRIQVGEQVDVSARTITGQQNVKTFVVQGVMQDSGILGSISSYAHRAFINELLNMTENAYQSVNVSIDKLEDVDRVTNELQSKLAERATVAQRMERMSLDFGSFSFVYQDEESEEWTGSRYSVRNLNDFTSQIDQLAAALDIAGLILLLVLIGITMIGILNTFRMVMYERIQEIGTMRAMGMQRKQVRRIFLFEAFFLSMFGYAAGLVLAFIGIQLLGLINIPLNNPFSLFSAAGKLSFPLSTGGLAGNFLLVSILTVIAAAFPARSAAKLLPAAALRSSV